MRGVDKTIELVAQARRRLSHLVQMGEFDSEADDALRALGNAQMETEKLESRLREKETVNA